VLWARCTGTNGRLKFDVLAAPKAEVRDTRGAGDSFVAGTVWGLLRGSGTRRSASGAVELSEEAMQDALICGLNAARLTVESTAAVSEQLCESSLSRAQQYVSTD